MFLRLSGISAPDIYISGGENLYVVGVNDLCVDFLHFLTFEM
jgi:hypothetical protein